METAGKTVGALTVATLDNSIWIRIAGRATFTSSLDLKNLVNELWQRGHRRFVLDICECIIMDSTFLGVLAGIGLKFAESNERGVVCSVQIANPNPRISDLLENLGVAHLFSVIQASHPDGENFEPLDRDGETASRVEVTRNCLEAHKILMKLNPANVGKFKDVAQFLAEDLKRREQANES